MAFESYLLSPVQRFLRSIMPQSTVIRVPSEVNMQMLYASVLQSVWIGFDSAYMIFYAHELFKGHCLTAAISTFTGSIFLGTLFGALFYKKKLNSWMVVFINAAIRSLMQLLIIIVPAGYISIAFLFGVGFPIGVIIPTLLAIAMKNLNVTQGNLIVSVIFACLAGGMLISSILLERNAHEIVYDNRRRPMIPSRPPDELFFMDVHSRYPAFIIIIFSVAFQVTSLHPLYALWKAPSEAPTDDEAIDSNASKVEVKKLLILCLIIGFNTNALFFSFPFYVLSHHFYMNGDLMVICHTIFCASFLFGRVIHTAICRRHEHSIVLAISFVVSGVAVCIFSFEPARLAASALYGLGFSMILPVLVLLVGRISYSYVYPLTSAFSLGPILFPPLLTTLLNSHGPQLFTSINFLLLIVTVFFFVWILNVQSRMDKPDGEHSAKVWRFFRGEGAFKRTRSLRKFIGSIRGSIRGRNYRRMQRASSPLGAPKASTGLHLPLGAPEDTNRLSPHYVSTYRSTQSRQKATIEVDDESSSTCTISISTPTPTSTTN